MTIKGSSKAKPAKPKPRSNSTGSKIGESAGKGPGRPRAEARPKEAKPKADAPGKRLRRGELDGLVIAYLRRNEAVLPLRTATVAKGVRRSSGAVGNCLERLAKAGDSPVRRAKDGPRAYDLEAKVTKTGS